MTGYPLYAELQNEWHTVEVTGRTIELLQRIGETSAAPRQIAPDRFEIQIDGQVKAVLALLDPEINEAIRKAVIHSFGTS